MKLLSVGTNAKTAKSDAAGEYLTAILYLAPANLAGREVCPGRSPGCSAACLNTAGRGIFPAIQAARIAKTKFFFQQKDTFLEQLHKEIGAHVKKCAKLGVKPAVRLNGTSDLPWENLRVAIGEEFKSLLEYFPNVQFYDYTKLATRVHSMLSFQGLWPRNYSLTYSLSETPQSVTAAESIISQGGNVAVVFEKLPTTFHGVPVVSGDTTDLRFLDPRKVVIGLTAKGKAKKDTSGFVRRCA